MDPKWVNTVSCYWIQSGQLGPYKDSVYEAEIEFSTTSSLSVWNPSKEKVQEIAEIMMGRGAFKQKSEIAHPFETYIEVFERLDPITLVEERGLYATRWHVKLRQIYND